MLITFVLLYLLASIGIGVYASRHVHSATDYIVAGRSLPLYITVATVFATWFGSETVLGVPSAFLREGLLGIISDPFGASLCLILVGLFFARPLYRMKLLTIGDFYRRKYGRTVEVMASMAICLSYLGWVSAQIIALGLVFNTITQGMVSEQWGMILGTAIVISYTLFGGMWSVALTDFMQMIIIVVGLLIIAFIVAHEVGGVSVVYEHAKAAQKLKMTPEWNLSSFFLYISAWITMGLGSISQQDVFQRVMSAKDEKTAMYGSILGGVFYLIFAFVPIFLAHSAYLLDPQTANHWLMVDSQKILPNMIFNHTPLFVQIMFFGALLSAIMSTSSGTLLAPSVMFVENIIKDLFPNISDQKLLRLIRITVVCFATIVLSLALNNDLHIYEMVENAYKITLVGAFVPLAFGLYWKRANTAGATLSIIFGLAMLILLERLDSQGAEFLMPSQLGGFLSACLGMFIGGYFGEVPEKKIVREGPLKGRRMSSVRRTKAMKKVAPL